MNWATGDRTACPVISTGIQRVTAPSINSATARMTSPDWKAISNASMNTIGPVSRQQRDLLLATHPAHVERTEQDQQCRTPRRPYRAERKHHGADLTGHALALLQRDRAIGIPTVSAKAAYMKAADACSPRPRDPPGH